MSTELLEILPRELKFTFELKKQCSCSVRLINKSNNHVAFKVKTTAPQKYCVRPNAGIIKPKSICDFTVTMQAQRLAPPDMICKDKFLVQSTVVPANTADEDITTSMFARDDGRYVEENKLRVILVSPPSSPVLSPINGAWKQVSDYEASILKDQVLRKIGSFNPRAVTKDVEKMENKPPKVVNKVEVEEPVKDVNYYGIMKDVEEPSKSVQYKIMKDVKEPAKDVEYERVKNVEEPAKDVGYKTMKEVEEPAKDIEHKAMKDVEELAKDIEHKTVKDMEVPVKDIKHKTVKDMEELAKDVEYETMKDEEEPAKGVEYKTWKNTEELKLVKDIEEMKSKVNELESKLSEAVVTISQLIEERRCTAQERESIRQELAIVRTKRSVRKVPAGFPFLFVLMVALVSITLGYLLND